MLARCIMYLPLFLIFLLETLKSIYGSVWIQLIFAETENTVANKLKNANDIFWYGYCSSAESMQGLRFFFFQFTPHPLECLCLREERSIPTYIGPTLAKSRGRQPSPTLAKIRFPQWWMGCFNGFNLRLLGGWVDRFRLLGLIVCWV